MTDPTQGNPASDEHLDDACRRPAGPLSAADLIRATDPNSGELDLYEGRHRAYQDAEDRRYGLEGPSAEEDFNSGGGWYG